MNNQQRQLLIKQIEERQREILELLRVKEFKTSSVLASMNEEELRRHKEYLDGKTLSVALNVGIINKS